MTANYQKAMLFVARYSLFVKPKKTVENTCTLVVIVFFAFNE